MDAHVDLETVKTWGLVLAIGLPVAGILLALVVRAVLLKVLVLVVFVGLGFLVWTQRAALLDYVHTCNGQERFFGITVTMPKAVQDACHVVSG